MIQVDPVSAREQRSVFAMMRMVHTKYERLVSGRLRELGLTSTEHSAMAFVHHVGAARPSEIAHACHLTRQSMHQTIQRLEVGRLVERWKGERAGRDVKIGLTQPGRALHETAVTEVARLQAALMGELGDRDRMILVSVLAETNRALEACTRHPVLFDD